MNFFERLNPFEKNGNEGQEAIPDGEALPEMPGTQEQVPEIQRGPNINVVDGALERMNEGWAGEKGPDDEEGEMEDGGDGEGEPKPPTIH